MSNKPWLVGLLQALGVVVYCIFVSAVFLLMQNSNIKPPAFLGTAFMLLFFVFSAAVTGALVFGYSIYLMMAKEIKKAMQILFFTLVFCLVFGAILVGLALVR